MERIRQAEGRIAARRCWEAARVAVSEETRDALQRAAIRYALKAIGIEHCEEGATPPGGWTDDVAGLPTWEGLARQASRCTGIGLGARGENHE